MIRQDKKRKRISLTEKIGRMYCLNFNKDDLTCINCEENNEGPYRAGCFKRVK